MEQQPCETAVPYRMQAAARARRHSSGGHSADPDFLSGAWQSALDALDLPRFDGMQLLSKYYDGHASILRVGIKIVLS